MNKKEKINKENGKTEEERAVNLKKTIDDSEIDQQPEERNGIIPEGMDFRKFIGCGG